MSRAMLARKAEAAAPATKTKAASTGLRIGEINDSFEREADRVADAVMAGLAAMPWSFSKINAGTPLQRKCDCDGSGECEECKKKKTLQRRAANSMSPSVTPPIVDEVLRSPGQPLDAQARAFFEPRFGHDFSKIRVHTDSQAAKSAREVNAVAYAVGRDVVFGTGQYAPAMQEGRRLLAHELAHVVQQTNAPALPFAGRRLQRQAAAHVPSDLEVNDVSDSVSPKDIFFARKDSALDASQVPKIGPLAGTTPAAKTRPLTLTGFVSEDENDPPILGTVLAGVRNSTVDKALKGAGHTGPRTPITDNTASVGNMDYRSMRKVEVLPVGAPSTTPHCATPAAVAGGPPAPPPGLVACTSASQFTTAQGEAKKLLETAITSLSASPLAAPTISQLDSSFGTQPATRAAVAVKVKANLSNLKTHIVSQMTPVSPNGTGAGHRCANQCDSTCQDAIAYNEFTDASARMTLCDIPTRHDSFMQEPDLEERAAVLIHEGLHGISLSGAAVGSGAKDFAYGEQRLIKFLDPDTALKNNDSYVIFVRTLNGQSPSVGRTAAQADVTTGAAMSAPEKLQVNRALAWLEGWSIWSEQLVENTYGSINQITEQGKTWADVFGDVVMKELASRFGLTAPPALPDRGDKFAVVAITERFKRISNILYNVTGLTLEKVAAGPTTWSAGPAASVKIGPDFFVVPAGPGHDRAQLDLLLQAIVTATTGISPAARPSYIALFDVLRKIRGGGSP
jgi:hypothetical protein